MSASMPVAGRGWAYAAALLGGLVSVAANVAHSYVPPADAGSRWSPQAGSVIGAVFWPVALIMALEVMARTPWPAAWCWIAVRWLGLLPVAVVAAVVSYRHLSGLLTFYREDALTATIGPLAVDGLMVMASGALLATSARRTITAVLGPARTAPDVAAVPVEDRGPDRTQVPDRETDRDRDRVRSAAGRGLVPAVRSSGSVPARGLPRSRPVPVDVADLLLVGRAVAADLANAGRPLTRVALIAGLRARGHRIATGRASELLRALKVAA